MAQQLRDGLEIRAGPQLPSEEEKTQEGTLHEM
jgi:hypothetical protein